MCLKAHLPSPNGVFAPARYSIRRSYVIFGLALDSACQPSRFTALMSGSVRVWRMLEGWKRVVKGVQEGEGARGGR